MFNADVHYHPIQFKRDVVLKAKAIDTNTTTTKRNLDDFMRVRYVFGLNSLRRVI